MDLTITAQSGVLTELGDSVFIILPAGLEYILSSYDPVSNASGSMPIVVDNNGETKLKLPLVSGLGNGSQIVFNLDIKAVDIGQKCGLYNIKVQTLSSRTEDCGTETCEIKVISGDQKIQVNIQKPNLDISSMNLTLMTMPPSGGSLEYVVAIENKGVVPQLLSDPIVIELYEDVNNNGFFDPGVDLFVTSIITNKQISPGQQVNLTGSIPLPPTGLCRVIGVVNANSACNCNTTTSNQTIVKINNDFIKNKTVCSGDIISIGPGAISGYDYQWLPVGSANLSALSSTVVTPTDFQFNNTSGSNIVWNYALRTSFQSCYSYDTMKVTLYPDNDATVSPQACEGLEFTLPGPTSGSNFMTTPAAGLMNPTARFPKITSVTAGTTTYTQTYDDVNGCATTRIYNVSGIMCAPNTGIGDTVFFDVNEDGIQNVGEPGIPDVTVYLYNSTNTTPGSQIGVAMTDSNGRYLFLGIPAGNYVVGFQTPDGFVVTMQNSGGNDTKDSDINPTSGLTGPYFIPNGMIDTTADAGFIPDCMLNVTIAEVSECQFLNPGQQREVTVDIDWSNAVYTYDFLGGSDTITLSILGQTFVFPITELSGDTSIVVVMPGGALPQDIIASVVLTHETDCLATDQVLGIAACIYDIALNKTLPSTAPLMYGGNLPFVVKVVNQGKQALNNIKINDYLPAGMTFSTSNNPGWMQSGSILMYMVTDTLAPAEVKNIPLNLTLIMSSEANAYLNFAEIVSFQDTLGVDRSAQDIDSTPDADPTNDAGGNPNTGSDNALNGNGTGAPGDTNPNTDEDDADPELVSIVDVALAKNIVTPGPYMFGQSVIFEIVVYNQGNINVKNVVVNDFIPAGYSYLPSNNPTWSETSGTATTIVGNLPALSDTTIQIVLKIEKAGSSDYVNIAEIQSFQNQAGNDITSRDIDSQADNDPTNDAGGQPGSASDGSLNGDGTGGIGEANGDTDEDDMDVAFLSIPMLNIEKSTTEVEVASSGVEGNFDVTFTIKMENTGTTKLNNLKLQDDLVEQLGGTFITIVTAPYVKASSATVNPTINAGYNGGVIDSILTGIDGCLSVNDSLLLEMTIEVTGLSGTDINEAVGMAIDSLGFMVMDQDTALIPIPGCFLSVDCPLPNQGIFTCLNKVPAAATNVATFNTIDAASDIKNYCQVPTITMTQTTIGTGCIGDTMVITRTYIIIDAGDPIIGEERDTCVVVYRVVDDVKPILMVAPTDLFLQCGAASNTNAISTWVNSNGGAVAADGCSSVTWTRTIGTPADQCGNTTTTPYTFRATDNCGNFISVVANVVINDVTDPVLTLPTAVDSVLCSANPTAALATWLASASATDLCGPTTITSALISTNDTCIGANTVIASSYLFTATDECGNVKTGKAVFKVLDKTAPVITAPANLVLSCTANFATNLTAWLQAYTVVEACQDYTVTNNYTGGVPSLCGTNAITVIWTVTDGCGASSTASANISYEAQTSIPTVTCPTNITLNCGDMSNDATIANWLSSVTASDDCGIATVSHNYPDSATGACGNSSVITITFTATDECSLTNTCMATISIQDTVKPTITYHAEDLMVECAAAGNAAALSNWVAAHGNSVATDACGTITWTSVAGMASDECGNTSLTTYTFTATDACGNTSTTTADYIIKDTTDPVIPTIAAGTAQCDGSGNAADIAAWADAVTATDLCGTASVAYTEFNNISACGGTETLVYLFTATDQCGNETTATAQFTITDVGLPSITCPAALTLECGNANNASLVAAWLNQATTTDVCSNIAVTHNFNGNLPANCGGTSTVIFTATDDCGNTSTCSAIITMDDTTNPNRVNCPINTTVSADMDCDAVVSYSIPTFNDNCMVTVAQTVGLPSGSIFPEGTTTITYVATDACDNSATCTFNITVVDDANPTIACPSNAITVCNTPGSCTWTSVGIAPIASSENCPGVAITYAITGATTATGSTDASGVVFMLGTSTVKYIIEDADGNKDSCQFNVIVEDCQAPTMICAADLTVECDGSGNTSDLSAWLITASATDICDGVITPTNMVFNTISGCGNTNAITYEFLATDAAGNTTKCYATFTIEDKVDPIINTEASDLSIECGSNNPSAQLTGWLNNHGGAVASDVCGNANTWTHNFTGALSDLCSSTGSVNVVFTVSDDCGNTASTMADFTITDTTPPTITCPVNITLDCASANNMAIITNWLATASATDDCDLSVSITNTSTNAPSCGNEIVTTYTFIATDACNNSASCNATVTTQDNTPPTFTTLPSDLIVECGVDNSMALDAWISDNAGARATDECGTVIITNSAGITSDDCGNSGTTIYTFTATDACLNTSTTTAKYIIKDTKAPTLLVPTNMETQECGSEDIATWLGTATATDLCGSASVTSLLFNSISGCGSTDTMIYQFTAIDDCGNDTIAYATFIVSDTTMPTIICPTTLALICGNSSNTSLVAAWLNSVTGINTCGGLTITNDFNGILPTNCGGTVTVTFTATDDCGNVNTCQAMISLDDDVNPEYDYCPSNITVNANSSCETVVTYALPIASDNCSVSSALTLGLASGAAFPLGTTTIVYTATDACNNTATCSFDILVEDNDEPSVQCPDGPITICTDADLCTWLSDGTISPVTSAGNCPGLTVAYTISGATTATGMNDAMGNVLNLGSNTITYTVTDAANNTAACNFNVVVKDCNTPALTCPVDITVECNPATNGTDLTAWLATPTARDTCDGDIDVTFMVYNIAPKCGNTSSTTYEFKAIDAAGNDTTCYATFTVVDVTPPTITTQAENLDVTCSSTLSSAALTGWLNNKGGATATDICGGNITWTNNYTTNLSDECGNTGAILVTFTATDGCGNTATTAATFSISDMVVPVITCPANITLECDNIANAAIINNWLLTVKATDNCDNAPVITNDGGVSASTCGSTTIVTYTFTATDACGNSATCLATVTTIDNTKPIITNPATDLIVECADGDNATALANWLIANGNTMAVDSCGSVTWTNVAMTTVDQCGMTSKTPYVFTATDECGNTSTSIANYIIEDTKKPTLIVPSEMTVECDGAGNTTELEAWLTSATATDNCGTPTLTTILFSSIDSCAQTGRFTYRFTARDECGNDTIAYADFIIKDTSAVTITKQAEDIDIQCSSASSSLGLVNWLNNHGFATADDDCGNITWSNNYGNIIPNCSGTGAVTVTFTATDQCGNSATTQAAFSITDDTPPIINCPTPITLECGNSNNAAIISIWLASVNASDDCSNIVTITNNYGSVVNNLCGGTQVDTVTFTAIDGCNNVITCTSTISIVDNTSPVFVVIPQDTTVECDGAGNSVALTTWLQDNADAMGIDSCGTVSISNSLEQTINNCGSSSEAIYTFTITDECGNTATAQASFIIEDTTVPVLVTPTDMTIECDGAGNTAALTAWLNTASATDVCGSPVVTNILFTSQDSCGNTGKYTYQFTAVDECGNDTVAYAAFTIKDTTAPDITTPASGLSAQCNGASNSAEIVSWLNNNGGAVASDICGNVIWSNNYGSISADCGTTGEVEVTFYAMDACGNVDSTTAIFEINDNLPPTWELFPQNLTLECNAMSDPYGQIDAWLAIAGGGEAEDSCSLVVYMDDFTGFVNGCGNTGSALVTFTASDACGNTSTAQATVTLVDNTPPALSVPAQDTTVSCDATGNMVDLDAWLAIYGNVVFTDECSTPLNYDSLLIETVSDCGMTTSYTYAFYATDDCGNTSVQSLATFTVIDTTSPIITPAMNMTVECDGSGNGTQLNAWLTNNGGATATDICSPGFTWEYDLVNFADSCGTTGERIYRFTVLDACGNSSTTEASFITEDTTNPMMVCCPDFDLNIGPDGTATIDVDDIDCGSIDICTPTALLIRSISKTVFTGANVGTNVVKLFVADQCGNIDSCMVNVNVIDTTMIGLAKRVVSTQLMPNGCTEIVYEINIENFGNVILDSVQVKDDLAAAGYTNCGSFTTTLTSDDFTVNSNFNGLSDTNLLTGGDDISQGDEGAILLTVTACGCPDGTSITNSATLEAKNPSGMLLSDTSVDGADPDPNGDNIPDESGTTNTTIGEMGGIGIAKRAVSVVLEANGCTEVIYELNIENYGNVDLDSVQVVDDLAAAGFTSCSSFTTSLTSDDFTVNPAFDGMGNNNLLSGLDDLPVGDQGAILLTVVACGCPNGTAITNSANVESVTPSGADITDISADGADPDPNNDGDPIEMGTTNTTILSNGKLGLAKRIVSSQENANGTVDVIYEFNIENFGNVSIDSIQVFDSISQYFMPCNISINSISSDKFTVNPSYNGILNNKLLLGEDDLAAGDKGAILLSVKFLQCNGATGPFMNTATACGKNIDGTKIIDISQNGSDPDPDNDGDPSNNSETTNIVFTFESFIGIAKNVDLVQLPGDGSALITFRFTVKNYGTTDLDSINLFDNVVTQFNPCSVTIENISSSPNFAVNLNYDGGVTDDKILTGNTNSLQVGEEGSVLITYRFFDCGNGSLNFCNQAFATAIDPSRTLVFDDFSEQGLDPDPDGNNDPTDNDNCTMVSFGFNPAIGIAKRVSEGPISNGNGCFDLTYEIRSRKFW